MGNEIEYKVGDKVKVIGIDYRNAYHFTVNKHYEVREVDDEEVALSNDEGTVIWLQFQTVKKIEKKEAPKLEANQVVVPTGTIGKDEIVGQDTNKNILDVAIAKNLPVLLVGDTGTGKTSIIRELGIRDKKVVKRMSITGETTVDEFVGKYELEAGKTVWRDGILLEAMRKGEWLVVDEINVALPEILFVLHSLLDDDNYVTVSQHAGEVVKPHKDFRFFATMNPTDEYAGTKELNKAFQSRFSVILTFHYPAPAIEAKIIADKTGIALADATKMADVAVALRKAKKDEKIFYTCSTRDLLHWGGLNDALGAGEAFRVSILNKAGIETDAVLEIYKHVIGRYINLEQPTVELTVEWFEREAQKIIDERKQFELDKEIIKKQITSDIVKKLTDPSALEVPVAIEAEQVAVATQTDLQDVFSTDYSG